MAIASRVMHQGNSSIGTQKLNSCFSWQVSFGCFMLCICFHSNASRVTLTRAGEITFRWTWLWWLDFHMHFSWASCTAFHSFCQGTCFLMDTTSSVICLGVAWIGMKNVWKVCALLVKIQEVGSRSPMLLHLLLCCWFSVRLAVLPVRMITVPVLWCVRCLLITERPKTPCHYRYQI